MTFLDFLFDFLSVLIIVLSLIMLGINIYSFLFINIFLSIIALNCGIMIFYINKFMKRSK